MGMAPRLLVSRSSLPPPPRGAYFSLGHHGGNDAQKTAGIIWLPLIAATASNVQGLPVWMKATHTITGAIVGVGSTQRPRRALGFGRQHCLGLDLHHPRFDLRRRDCYWINLQVF